MKNYVIECNHEVYIDSYKKGELENANNYDTNGTYKCDSPIEAIQKHFECLGYDFNNDYAQNDEEEDGQNKVWYSVLVDSENIKADQKEIEKWKKNKLVLYSNNMTIYVYELIAAKIY